MRRILAPEKCLLLDLATSEKVAHNAGRRFSYVHGSVIHEPTVDALVAEADVVYHFAAVVGVGHYVADPYSVMNVNVNGTQVVLRCAHRHNRRVVFSSTSEVYGRNPKVPGRRTMTASWAPRASTGGRTQPRRPQVSILLLYSRLRLPWWPPGFSIYGHAWTSLTRVVW